MIVFDLALRAIGWLFGAGAFAAVFDGRTGAAGVMAFVAVTLVSTGRQMRYRRLARQLDRWCAEDIEVARRRRMDP